MSKGKNKMNLKKKKKIKKKIKKISGITQNKETLYQKPATSLSKKTPSSNWISFMESNGLEKQLFKITNYEKIKQEKNLKGKNTAPIITKVVALDCEMVSDLDNKDMLARVSLVNYKLECIYDKFVKPTAEVGDYRTRFSGIRKTDLEGAEDFETVHKEVKSILYNKILVGHALHNDFRVLKFGHHQQLIRDTSKYGPFKEVSDAQAPSLKKLAKVFLNENIQEGEHNSVEDAKTAMKLYKKFRQEWEVSLIKHKSQSLGALNSAKVENKFVDFHFQKC